MFDTLMSISNLRLPVVPYQPKSWESAMATSWLKEIGVLVWWSLAENAYIPSNLERSGCNIPEQLFRVSWDGLLHAQGWQSKWDIDASLFQSSLSELIQYPSLPGSRNDQSVWGPLMQENKREGSYWGA